MAIRQSLSRLTDRIRARARRNDTGGEMVAGTEPQGLVRTVASRALSHMLETRVADVVDLGASRLLELDDDASVLAAFFERAALRHGRDAITAVIFRHNLLLDGTLLGVIEPILRGERELRLTDVHAQRARETLITLIGAVASLDDTGLGDAPDLAILEAHLHELTPVWPYLRGETDEAELARFLLGSYTLFLQSFLLRTSVRWMAAAARGEAPLAHLAPQAE